MFYSQTVLNVQCQHESLCNSIFLFNPFQDEQQAQEREEDRAAGYDLVRLDEVAAAAARIKDENQNGNASGTSIREEHLMKYGNRFGVRGQAYLAITSILVATLDINSAQGRTSDWSPDRCAVK